MNLYEINEEILNCLMEADEETGEIIDVEKLNSLIMEKNTKVENIGCWIKNLDAESKAIREEEKALAARRKSKENKIESLKKYLFGALEGHNFESVRIKMSYRNNPASVQIYDEDILVNWLETNGHEDAVKYEVSVSKTDVKEILKGGYDVPGCELTQSQSLVIK